MMDFIIPVSSKRMKMSAPLGLVSAWFQSDDFSEQSLDGGRILNSFFLNEYLYKMIACEKAAHMRVTLHLVHDKKKTCHV